MDPENPERKIIRTILSIDRDQRSLTFAGDVPEGWQARLMRGVFDRLVLGAKLFSPSGQMRHRREFQRDASPCLSVASADAY